MAKLTPAQLRAYNKIRNGGEVLQGDGTQFRTVKALADAGLIKLSTWSTYGSVYTPMSQWGRAWAVSKLDD